MPHHAEGFGVLPRQEPQMNRPLFGEDRIGSDDLAVDDCRERGLSQSGTDIAGDIDRPNAARVLFDTTIGQGDT